VKSSKEIVHAFEDVDKPVLTGMNCMSRLKDLGVTMAPCTEIKEDPHRKEDIDSNENNFCRRRYLKGGR
jgi:hypothetical protein